MFSLILRLLIGVGTVQLATAFANSAVIFAARHKQHAKNEEVQQIAVNTNLREPVAQLQNNHNVMEHTANTVEINLNPLVATTENSAAKTEVRLAINNARERKKKEMLSRHNDNKGHRKANRTRRHKDLKYQKRELDNEKAQLIALKAIVEGALNDSEIELDPIKTELMGKMRFLDEWLDVSDKSDRRLEMVKEKKIEKELENPMVQQLLDANASMTAKEGVLHKKNLESKGKEHSNASGWQVANSTSAAEVLEIADKLMDEIAMNIANGDVDQAHKEIGTALENYWALEAMEERANASQALNETKDIPGEDQETASNNDKVPTGEISRHQAWKIIEAPNWIKGHLKKKTQRPAMKGHHQKQSWLSAVKE